ncbi:coiled coil domain-containing protein [Desulfopila sp. IMCC35008]|uniref:coiled coil domain-containing protein n=1 Tax=Desulfopila sp. IMCC35008 TaxID=2653858 RepID=UPI0013D3DFBD|nr:coiled coil domain-containing protein [Desulfopila sp. IMCC35008]
MNKKEAYEQKVQAQVDEWNAEILKLKAQAAKAKAEVQINFNNQVEELQQKKETVNEKLIQLKEASGESWEDLKAGIEEGLDLLKTTVNSIISRYK